MSLYGKKLHVAKGGTTYNINLYTNYLECSPASDHMKVDGVDVHFSVSTNLNDYGATPLRIKESSGRVYCVRTTGVPAYGTTTFKANGSSATYTFTVPRGVTKIKYTSSSSHNSITANGVTTKTRSFKINSEIINVTPASNAIVFCESYLAGRDHDKRINGSVTLEWGQGIE